MLHYETPDSEISTDSAVIDDKGRVVGRVVDTVHDETRQGPDFLVVDPGRFRSSRFVPLSGAYSTAAGNVVVPFAKWWVMCSPKAAKGHVISSRKRDQLEDHYGALYDWRR